MVRVLEKHLPALRLRVGTRSRWSRPGGAGRAGGSKTAQRSAVEHRPRCLRSAYRLLESFQKAGVLGIDGKASTPCACWLLERGRGRSDPQIRVLMIRWAADHPKCLGPAWLGEAQLSSRPPEVRYSRRQDGSGELVIRHRLCQRPSAALREEAEATTSPAGRWGPRHGDLRRTDPSSATP